MNRCAWMAAVLMLVPTVAQAQQNLVSNGSFESGVSIPTQDIALPAGSTDIDAWTIFGQSIDYLGPPWDVSDGSRAVDLDGSSSIFSGVSQAFSTVAGRTYMVTFDLSGNPQGGPTVKQLRVTVDGLSQDYTFDTTARPSRRSPGTRTVFRSWRPVPPRRWRFRACPQPPTAMAP